MSAFITEKIKKLSPYTPGEQPKERRYVKLNTNESPFEPSPKAIEFSSMAAKTLMLYPDPDCRELTSLMARELGVEPENVIMANGSDEVLNFAFMAYCDSKHPAVFPDITYGFYKVFADLNGVPYKEILLKEDFTIDTSDFDKTEGMIVIANPNAPTGISLSVSEIESLISRSPQRVIVIDEAYVDFGGHSVVPLIKKYNNLIVTGTFSKSRSMAGARLGFAVGCKDLIADLNRIKYSTNPYNINSMTAAAGIGALMDREYFLSNCRSIIENRERCARQLSELGFSLTHSDTNFLFAQSDRISGEELYLKLKEKGILVRHFGAERIKNYVRITIGSTEQMDLLVKAIKDILEV